MSKHDLYVIECRDPEGKLDFAGLQPEKVFGWRAISGITSDEMAHIIFLCKPECDNLHGTNIPKWPSEIDPRWRARLKT